MQEKLPSLNSLCHWCCMPPILISKRSQLYYHMSLLFIPKLKGSTSRPLPRECHCWYLENFFFLSFARENILIKCRFLLVPLKCHRGGCSQNLSFSPQTGVCLLPHSNCSFWNVFIHHASTRTNMQHNAEVCTPPGEFVLIPGFQNGGSRRFSLRNHNAPFNRCYFYLQVIKWHW